MVDRRESRGRRREYHVTLEPGPTGADRREVEVPAALYAALPLKGAAVIEVRPGSLGAPWFRVYPNNTTR